MSLPDAAQEGGYAVASFEDAPAAATRSPSLTWTVFARAGIASTVQRIQRGEGALLAINLSLIAAQGAGWKLAVAQALVSGLTIALMYAYNDFYDAPADWNNPKKDRALISTYMEHRSRWLTAIFTLKFATVGLALAMLGTAPAAAVIGVMLVNLTYSHVLKGVPVLDVAWCGVWGTLYAAIVGAPLWMLLLVGLMTAICHLYQALDDRVPDAANGITTTAVRSPTLSRAVLVTLSALLFVVLREPLGAPWACSAAAPLALLFVGGSPATGWLLTKVYFGVVWLYLLGIAGAAG